MSEGIKSIGISATKTLINSILVSLVVLGSLGLGYHAMRPIPPTGEELAIALAKQSVQTGVEDFASMVTRHLGGSDAVRLDSTIQSRLGELRGELVVKGWVAKEVANNLYMVSFTWAHSSGGERGFFFEVDTKNRFARPIGPDDELALKYGMRSQEDFQKEEVVTRDFIKKKYPEGALQYANHTLTIQGRADGDYNPQDVAQEIHRSLKGAFEHRRDQYLHVKMTKGSLVGEHAARY
ncbi:hypothetical protein [Myxococcus qinghaiensis]|uniref:hypothetical protein n=1 Tax=Myxococcus qinghaiensis TaxID=2906758 RepID=UPI0020A75609|nr:hypothetical protein [Myxococcus qinghaiensis]MCP3169060.1 hypothetical protein [Myxococcus qinghaiensis]